MFRFAFRLGFVLSRAAKEHEQQKDVMEGFYRCASASFSLGLFRIKASHTFGTEAKQEHTGIKHFLNFAKKPLNVVNILLFKNVQKSNKSNDLWLNKCFCF